MNISRHTAELIVSEISRTLSQPINLMDRTGRIIASTDPKRVGTIHSGALKAMQESLECLIVRHSGEYAGARIGINIPLHHGSETIGAVGITGNNYDELSRYVRLIRKTAEMLLQAQELQEPSKAAKQQALLEKLLFSSLSLDSSFLQDFTSVFPVNLHTHYRAAVLSFSVSPEAAESLVRLLDALISQFVSSDFSYQFDSYFVLFSSADEDSFIAQLTSLQSAAQLRGSPIHIGYTRTASTLQSAQQSFHHAKTACHVAEIKRASLPLSHDDMVLELLLPELSPQAKQTYLRRVFGAQHKAIPPSWHTLLSTFYRYDGSLSKTAQALFLHKNTVQYQLRRIAEQTGFDPRRYDGAVVFQLALLLSDSL